MEQLGITQRNDCYYFLFKRSYHRFGVPFVPYNKKTKHHLVPRSRGGPTNKSNILLLWDVKHNLWHSIFGNCTLKEIIFILYYDKQFFENNKKLLSRLFYKVDRKWIVTVLLRLEQIKKAQKRFLKY